MSVQSHIAEIFGHLKTTYICINNNLPTSSAFSWPCSRPVSSSPRKWAHSDQVPGTEAGTRTEKTLGDGTHILHMAASLNTVNSSIHMYT